MVTASITGFGLTGPHSVYKAPSILCSAMGGVMYLCGSEDQPPLAEPMNQPYHLASAFAAAGVLLALRHRESTGRGQVVEVSCQEVQAAQQHVLVNYSANANVLKRAGSRTPVGGGMPYGIYPASDGFCHIVVIATSHWRSFVDWMGKPDALTDAVWDNRHVRIANPDLIEHLTAEFTSQFTKGEFFLQGQACRVDHCAREYAGGILERSTRAAHRIVRGGGAPCVGSNQAGQAAIPSERIAGRHRERGAAIGRAHGGDSWRDSW